MAGAALALAEEDLLATALGLSLLGSFGGLLLASSLLLFTDRVRTRLVPWLVSYAVGALLGVALLALLPEALETMKPASAFGTLLAGILIFFVLEKLVLLRHCHTDACHVHGAAAPLVLLGDASDPKRSVMAARVAQHAGAELAAGNGEYPSSLMGVIALLRQALYDAEWYQSMEQFYAANPTVERATPRGVRIETKFLHGARPLLIDAKGPMIEAAIDAMEDVWGRRPVRVREGGSIPIVSTFVDELRAPVLLIGFGLPDDRLHAPNEKLDLAQYVGGIRSTARLLDRVGSL